MGKIVPRTVIATLPPQIIGGVATNARLVGNVLRGFGHDVSFASYSVRGAGSRRNVSLFGGLRGARPSIGETIDEDGFRHIEVGCWFPELEFTYTGNSGEWQQVLSEFDHVFVVGGSPLIAHPVACSGVPHGFWCADDVDGDRDARHMSMPSARRVFDAVAIKPVLRRQQRRIMSGSGLALGISRYTVERLRRQRPDKPELVDHLAIPVDTEFFAPAPDRAAENRIGFAGRIGDPRKNASLLLRSLEELAKGGSNASLWVAGPKDAGVEKIVHEMGLAERVHFCGVLSIQELREFYQSLDVLVITSDREGLAIVGIEALACGVPVVSTRCGGPEDYVEDGQSGFLSSRDPEDIAECIERIIGVPAVRRELSAASREIAVQRFSTEKFRDDLSRIWNRIWAEPIERSADTSGP